MINMTMGDDHVPQAFEIDIFLKVLSGMVRRWPGIEKNEFPFGRNRVAVNGTNHIGGLNGMLQDRHEF